MQNYWMRQRAQLKAQFEARKSTGQNLQPANEDVSNFVPQVTKEVWRSKAKPGEFIGSDEKLVVVRGCNVDARNSLLDELVGITRADGKTIWTVPIPETFESGPVLAKDAVLYVTRDFKLVGLDRATGAVRFTVELEAEGKTIRSDGKQSVHFPVVAEDRVYIATNGKGLKEGHTGHLFALDVKTGTKIWEKQLEGGAEHTPVLLGENLLIAGAPFVYLVRATDGKEIWKADLKGIKEISMGISVNNRYYMACVDNPPYAIKPTVYHALDLATGQVLWKMENSSWKNTSLAADEHRVISEEFDSSRFRLVAMDAATGKKMWVRKGESKWSMSIQDGQIHVLDGKDLVALSVEDGKELWKYTHKKSVVQPPVCIGNRVYTVTEGGEGTIINAIDLSTHIPVWTTTAKVDPGNSLSVFDPWGILLPGYKKELLCLH